MSQQEAPPRMAADLGHQPEWDPPGLSAVRRWTCSECGDAVLDSGTAIYGSAVRERCDPTGSGM